MTHSEASSMLRSRVARRRVTHSSTAATVHVAPRCIAKPINPAQIAETANASVKTYAITVTLEETRQAMRMIADKSRTIAEGAGALSLAAALQGEAADGPIVCVVSGGNIDLAKFAELVSVP